MNMHAFPNATRDASARKLGLSEHPDHGTRLAIAAWVFAAWLVTVAFATESLILTFVLAAGALSLAAVGVVYARGNAGLMRTGKPSRIRRAAAVVLWPYRKTASLRVRAARVVDDRARYVAITPTLMAGSLLAGDREFLREHGATAVLDLAAELPVDPRVVSGRTLTSIPLLEGLPPSVDDLRRAAQWYATERSLGRVFLHAGSGRSRGLTVAAACMLAGREADDVDDAIAWVERCSPGAPLSRACCDAIRGYARTLSPSVRPTAA